MASQKHRVISKGKLNPHHLYLQVPFRLRSRSFGFDCNILPTLVKADGMVPGKNGGEKSVLLHDLVVMTHPALALATFSNSLCKTLAGS